MNHKRPLLCMILLAWVATSCVSPTPKPLPIASPKTAITLEPTATPFPTPISTATTIPTLTAIPIKSNAVAFVVGDWQEHTADSLWIANLDGSGERRLVDVGGDAGQNDITQLTWSPDGQWLSVTRQDSLRIVSADGSQAKVLVGKQPVNGRVIFGGAWSPDSTRIAFTRSDYRQHTARLGIVDMDTERITYPITVSTDPVTTGTLLVADQLKWTPDGQWLLFGRGNYGDCCGLKALHISDGAIASLDESTCSGSINSLEWSTTGKWLAIWEYGNGRYAHGWTCLSSLTGEHIYLDVQGHSSNPVWSLDGRSIYVVAMTFNPDDPHLDLDPRLMRFDLDDRRLVRLTSLKSRFPAFQSVLAMSPDGQTLSNFVVKQEREAIFQIISTNGTILHEPQVNMQIFQIEYSWPVYAWTADSQHLVFAAGEYSTPDGSSVQTYGSLFSLDIRTGKLIQLTDLHWIKAWTIYAPQPSS